LPTVAVYFPRIGLRHQSITDAPCGTRRDIILPVVLTRAQPHIHRPPNPRSSAVEEIGKSGLTIEHLVSQARSAPNRKIRICPSSSPSPDTNYRPVPLPVSWTFPDVRPSMPMTRPTYRPPMYRVVVSKPSSTCRPLNPLINCYNWCICHPGLNYSPARQFDPSRLIMDAQYLPLNVQIPPTLQDIIALFLPEGQCRAFRPTVSLRA